MHEPVPFIGREDELNEIRRALDEWGTLRILCIQADGGIGKTRLLQEICNRYRNQEHARRIVSDIIDFDDHRLHLIANLERQIAAETDEHLFQPYLNGLIEQRKLEMRGASYAHLQQVFSENSRRFCDCFNTVTNEKRVVFCSIRLMPCKERSGRNISQNAHNRFEMRSSCLQDETRAISDSKSSTSSPPKRSRFLNCIPRKLTSKSKNIYSKSNA